MIVNRIDFILKKCWSQTQTQTRTKNGLCSNNNSSEQISDEGTDKQKFSIFMTRTQAYIEVLEIQPLAILFI